MKLKHSIKIILLRLGILSLINKEEAKIFKRLINKIDESDYQLAIENEKVSKLERFKIGTFNWSNKKIIFNDSASFLFMYDEIFEKEIYKFHSHIEKPYIIDCGANIGLSVLYFKELFPKAQIVAFEPDKTIYSTLVQNCAHLQDVNIVNKALWDRETTLEFYSEGADGGRLTTSHEKENRIVVETDVLIKYLNKKVDLLKIDIEGAEGVVLLSSKEYLHNVERIFIEFHSFENKPQDLQIILSILNESGFRYIIQHIGVFSPHPFVQVNTSANMDLQLNIFGYRK